uniref:Uncharacterized protein n=1 Tax=Polytomella parva TaxID=51329 RepID=A0A7S0YKM9_9CHLO
MISGVGHPSSFYHNRGGRGGRNNYTGRGGRGGAGMGSNSLNLPININSNNNDGLYQSGIAVRGRGGRGNMGRGRGGSGFILNNNYSNMAGGNHDKTTQGNTLDNVVGGFDVSDDEDDNSYIDRDEEEESGVSYSGTESSEEGEILAPRRGPGSGSGGSGRNGDTRGGRGGGRFSQQSHNNANNFINNHEAKSKYQNQGSTRSFNKNMNPYVSDFMMLSGANDSGNRDGCFPSGQGNTIRFSTNGGESSEEEGQL